jgi:1,4-alpha-glucan branching enzyme
VTCTRLPGYLRDLGINGIEIMPVMEFSDELAHAQGIAVIMDVVYNHFGPGDLDLWRFDGWSDFGVSAERLYKKPHRGTEPRFATL